MSSNRTLFLIEIAIFTALALVLDIIPFLKFKIWPAGGSISFAMIPIFIVAFRWGLKGGIISGFLWGVLQIAIGDAYILNFWQGAIEYGFAFLALGFAGVFASSAQQAFKQENRKKTFLYIMFGVLLGTSLRFIAHFVAGIIFFGDAAPEGQPAWIYSLVYNSSYLIPGFILSTLVVYYLFQKQPKTLLKNAA